MMNNLFKYKPLEAEARIVQLYRELAALRRAARKVSQAASELKKLESSGLSASALSDAWDAAYERLYTDNEALKMLLEVQDE